MTGNERPNPALSSVLSRDRFFSGVYDEELGVRDVTWYAPDGAEMTEAHWHDPAARALMMRLDGRAQPTGVRKHGTDATLLLIVNGHADAAEFRLPEAGEGLRWRVAISTDERFVRGSKPAQREGVLTLCDRALLLVAQP